MSLEIKILAGAESKQFLVHLEKLVKRMEAVATATPTKAKESDAETETEETETSFDGAEEETESEAEETEESEAEAEAEESEAEAEESETESFDDAAEDEAPKKSAKATKATKAKKVTTDDVNDSAKAAVTRIISKRGVTGKDARGVVLACLKKNFKTETISKLDDDQLAKAVTVLAALK